MPSCQNIKQPVTTARSHVCASKSPSLVAYVMLIFIATYRMSLAGLLGGQCRFVPSCSIYAREAILHYGACRGLFKIVARLARCGPWHPGGYDPIQNVRGEYSETSAT